ncbi:N6-mAMP deaminase-like isoform X3 [Nymphaea colorata]|uniref:N6-mAMP deaminase-like isoform X3 n=1 Tax=Nymphaea colorata TaxID=210225 RepID=UPI00129E4474|nr:N6-mAMP deaminase-like isoform X3 [Nymphaea colorata]
MPALNMCSVLFVGGGQREMGEEESGFVDMEWCLALPKIELHAHLNGSVRDATLLELAKDLGNKGVLVFSDVEHVIKKSDRSLAECFKLFDLIHIITTDHATVSRITKEVVEDFAAENVVYLELRTTPKTNETIGMTKSSYVEAVMKGLRAVETVEVVLSPCASTLEPEPSTSVNDASTKKKQGRIFVCLLLSIDRRETTASAMETVQLALKMRNQGVVGLDLSGNPITGDWITFLPALSCAREQGLPITLHCGEVRNPKEIKAMLEFCPERIGHACCLEDEEWKMLKSLNIPVEICLTSNVRTNSISSLHDHHFGLSKAQMFELSRGAIRHIFAQDGVKAFLNEVFDSAQTGLLWRK